MHLTTCKECIFERSTGSKSEQLMIWINIVLSVPALGATEDF